MPPHPPPADALCLLPTHEFAPQRGGIATYIEGLATTAAQCGRPTTVIAPGPPHTADPAAPFQILRSHPWRSQDWPARLRTANFLRRFFAQHDPASCHLILAEPALIRTFLYAHCLRLPIPQYLSIVFHGSELRSLTAHNHRRCRLDALLHHAKAIGTVSNFVQTEFANAFPHHAHKCRLTPGAVRPQWCALPPPPPPPHAPPFNILCVARIHPRKGQDVLLQAIAQLPNTLRSDIHIHLVGPATRPAFLRSLTATARTHALNLTHSPELSDPALAQAYANAHLVCLPSRPHLNSIEGLGLAILEAAHFKRPVVASLTGGTADALTHQFSGLLVPPNDPHALANAIHSLCLNPSLALSLAANAHASVHARFNWLASLNALSPPLRP